MRENEKIINYKGKQVRILKFNVLDGCYITQKVFSSFLPDVLESQLGLQRPFTPQKEMSRDEFCEFLVNIMQYAVYVQTEPIKVDIPILNDNGSLAVNDFEFSDVFLLALEVLTYNIVGFFTQENIEYFSQLLQNTAKKISALTTDQ
jgi:hypothetical protein